MRMYESGILETAGPAAWDKETIGEVRANRDQSTFDYLYNILMPLKASPSLAAEKSSSLGSTNINTNKINIVCGRKEGKKMATTVYQRRKSPRIATIFHNVAVCMVFITYFLGLVMGDVQDEIQDDMSNMSSNEILLRLYDNTRGLRWDNRDGWLQSPEFCSWYGIECYEENASDQRRVGHIRSIDLSGNHLQGTIPQEVFELPYLEKLALRDNVDLDLTFERIADAQYLTELDISETNVQSLDGIEAASPNLKLLHITQLGLSGPIPAQIFQLTNLEGLFANYNKFQGPLPSQIGLLTFLTNLYLYDNDLTGQIPSEIGLLSNLVSLTLAQNSFGGRLPDELNQCTKLEVLAIHRMDGSAKGDGIQGPLPSLASFGHLTELQLQNQRLTGSIPQNFLHNAPKDEVIMVDLANNLLTGAVPEDLREFARLELYLENNQISAVTDNLCSDIPGWMGGDVAALGCDALLCRPGYAASHGRASQTESCSVCQDADFWGSTACSSSIATPSSPSNADNEQELLILMYNAMGGQYWKNTQNWLNPAIDKCDWHGVHCENGSVIGILLQNNDLTSSFPSKLFMLPNLRVLDLSSNSIDFSFAGISNAQSLEELHLNQCDLDSLDGIEELASTSIRRLQIASNYFQGSIDVDVFAILSLTHLDIAHNRFTGPLHPLIGAMTNLEYLMLEHNSFSGQIPASVGNLVNLVIFSAAENDFSGTLPPEFDSLSNLETLSLHQITSANGIGGELPSFPNLRRLTKMQLDSNQLIGTLPTNFLQNTDVGDNSKIEILLSDNMIEGGIPSDWTTRFQQLVIDLTGNLITSIDDQVCDQGLWMEGSVFQFSCDAILCSPGYYNSFGRQVESNEECLSCPQQRNYYGAKRCESSAAGNNNNDGNPNNGGSNSNVPSPPNAPNADNMNERDILTELFNSAGGNDWRNRGGWQDSSDHCSDWFGIDCDQDGRVVSIRLQENGLKGSVVTSIYNLPSLRELDVEHNQINFSFQGISRATNLAILKLSGINLDSVAGVGQAQSLTELHLTDNDLQGSFPEELLGLRNLRELYLNFNSLTGRIPQDISTLTNLEQLFLFHNRFEGQIPAAIGMLTNLKTLSLSENNFRGTLPPELNQLTSLEVFAIQREGGAVDSSVEGNVGINQGRSDDKGLGITGPLLAFDNLKNIRQLYLGVNGLTGTIPYNFLNGVEDKASLIEVDLIANQLTGTVPASLTQFEQLTIYLADNMFSAVADGLCMRNNWMGGQVERFDCDAILCPPNTYSEFGRQQDADSECSVCPAGTSTPYFGSFNCLTSEEHASLNEREILTALFSATDGVNWKHHENWLDPDESICSWYGVSCISGDIESVESIHLTHNGLRGIIPTVLYDLPNLREVNFARNPVSLSFNGIRSAQNLQYLNLDSTHLHSLNGIQNAENLMLLHARGNDFGNTFPTEVAQLRNLMVLDLSENSFGGPLPSVLQNLGNLVYFSCSECDLSGIVPSWLGSLANLEYIQLDGNSFIGSLPDSLNSLAQLKHVDFSNQIAHGGSGLNGTVPSFSGSQQLIELYLQRNQFEGNIPESFLANVANTERITVDLRENSLTGSIPAGLTRIADLQLYLADNSIDSLSSAVCSTNWNDRENMTGDCNFILCAPGTFNALGRATSGLPCAVCPSDGFATSYGSTECGADLEKDIIEAVYLALGGNDWTHSDGWLGDGSICEWFGITCYNGGFLDGRVQKIDLSYNNLKGTLGSFIWELRYLNEINLRQNDINVSFAGMANAQNLQTLQLSETRINSVEGMSSAPALLMLHLTNNDITGTIPEELFEMTQLEGLYLNYNEFTGTLSTNIGKLSALRELYIFHNKLNGTIPSQIGMLDDLETLSIGENKFTGTIPLDLNWLENLRVLALQREVFEVDPSMGFIFVVQDMGLTGPIPPFNHLPNLRELYLSNNHLQGTIPSNFLAAVSDKSATIRADLTSNMFHGAVPSSLTEFGDLRLYLAGNQIHEIPNEICAKQDWMNGGMQDGCDAFLCPPGSYNVYGRRVGAEVCHDCNYRGSAVFYGSTRCGLMFPEGLDERSILRELYEETFGGSWIESTNWMQDDVSVCDWFGVTCVEFDNGDSHKVTELVLPSNGLRGTVPSVVFYLRALRVLNLRHNDIAIPLTDIKSSSIEELYLDSTRLDTLAGVGEAWNLRTLRVHKNMLGGQTIPDELFNLSNLNILDISESGLGGTLSSRVGNLRNLTTFLCHENSLTGDVPSTLGMLTQLQDLFMSENDFVGTLPTELNGMTSLQRLYLNSYDQRTVGITGPLLSFSEMPKLRQLHLGSNLLTGAIPADFLAAVDDTSESIHVDLKSNHLSGALTSVFSRFTNLFIDVTDNMIEEIDDSLCQMSLWNDGAVGNFECNGLLCPAGTFNDQGRQSSQDTPCNRCADVDATPYLGKTTCVSAQKRKEREILELLYQVTDGDHWTRRDNWMDENTDVCNWYGISCRNDATVESIMLGSNNLAGTPPRELFELEDLKFLWLYSNPIDFSFEGIGKAKSLTSLLLDSTGLRSLIGIGDATSLVDVDVRFNRLTGPLPEEMRNLRNLESFSCSSNQLTGTVPAFSQNNQLTTLRLGGNRFGGTIPAFSVHPALQSLDLSGNRILGSIPHNLLQLADTSGKIFIDMSSNMVTGTVPAELGRFADLTIYLRENMIEGLEPDLCSKGDWNEGDVGLFECDGILCPPNTYSPDTGRASRGGSECLRCDRVEYFGATSCGSTGTGSDSHHQSTSASHTTHYRLGSIAGIFVAVIFSTTCLFL